MKTITQEELQNGFTHIAENYFMEITTGKTYAITYLDDIEAYSLLEPEQFEDNMQKIQKGIGDFIDKLAKELELEKVENENSNQISRG